jgi:hypothetical protein
LKKAEREDKALSEERWVTTRSDDEKALSEESRVTSSSASLPSHDEQPAEGGQEDDETDHPAAGGQGEAAKSPSPTRSLSAEFDEMVEVGKREATMGAGITTRKQRGLLKQNYKEEEEEEDSEDSENSEKNDIFFYI